MAGADIRLHLLGLSAAFTSMSKRHVGHQEFFSVEFLDEESLRCRCDSPPAGWRTSRRSKSGVQSQLMRLSPRGKDDVRAPSSSSSSKGSSSWSTMQIHVGLRTHAAEQNFRHPVHGKARISGDSDRRRPLLRDGLDLVFELRRRAEVFADRGSSASRPLSAKYRCGRAG